MHITLHFVRHTNCPPCPVVDTTSTINRYSVSCPTSTCNVHVAAYFQASYSELPTEPSLPKNHGRETSSYLQPLINPFSMTSSATYYDEKPRSLAQAMRANSGTFRCCLPKTLRRAASTKLLVLYPPFLRFLRTH